jgi:rhodanese-related sulfurtransferase
MANKVTSKELQGRQDEYMYVDVREVDELEDGVIDVAMNIPLGQLIRKARHGDLDWTKHLEDGITTLNMILDLVIST